VFMGMVSMAVVVMLRLDHVKYLASFLRMSIVYKASKAISTDSNGISAQVMQEHMEQKLL
jgi:hypothetical protein